jgi:hypothetical protein
MSQLLIFVSDLIVSLSNRGFIQNTLVADKS